MKVLNIHGVSGSGKTTTAERIIAELTARGYRVGAVREVCSAPPETQNAAQLTAARGNGETNLQFGERLSTAKILEFFAKDYDWVVMEGVSDVTVPTIVTAHDEDGLNEFENGMTFCVSGRIASQIGEYRGVPVIDAVADVSRLVDLIELKVYDLLPSFPPECCTACGMTCAQLGRAILDGKKRRTDCVADRGVELLVNGRRIDMVPFVQSILKNAVLGVAGELEGYVPGCEIEIRF